MRDTKLPNVTTPVQDVSNSKKVPLLIASGVILIILFVVTIITICFRNKQETISFIDDAITSIESMFSSTDDIDEELSDLPENFLDSEVVTGDEIDESITDLDEQMEELDGLDEDFELEAEDVGLE